MSGFTRTLIVDGDGNGDATNIADAITALDGYGGVIYVEEYYNGGNCYEISSPIEVPSNVTIIGNGNVVLNVTDNVSAFVNYDQTSGDERITISGLNPTLTVRTEFWGILPL